MRPVKLHRSSSAPASWSKRLGWLVLIWVMSVLALAIIAYGFRLFMQAAGLSL